MGRAAWGMAAGGQAARAAECTTDLATLGRVIARLRAGMAGVDPLSRHERLCLPADSMESRRVTLLRNARPGCAEAAGRVPLARQQALAALAGDYAVMTAAELDAERKAILRDIADAPPARRDLVAGQLVVLGAEIARRGHGKDGAE